MNNERDELAQDLMRANQTTVSADAMYEQEAEEYAEALITAGYRKHRVITTIEELDALPNGSIVVDSEPDVLAKKGGKWQSPNYADDRFDSRHLDFPVTVISEGATK